MTDAFLTADLCDTFGDAVTVAKPLFASFGKRRQFSGPIRTVACFEDNSLVRASLETAGNGAVLVVDGGGSDRCALLGGMLAELAAGNGWAGLIINGYVRDSLEIATFDIGIRALGTCPRKSRKQDKGEIDSRVSFAGAVFVPGHFVYVDEDGIVVSERDLMSAAKLSSASLS